MAEQTQTDSRGLIVVDVQNDFCEGGALAVDGGAETASAIRELIVEHRSEYAEVVATRDDHIDPGLHFAPPGEEPDFVTTWPVHCRAGTDGAGFHPNLGATVFDEVIYKGRYDDGYSGFRATPGSSTSAEQDTDGGLADQLRDHGIAAVDIVGIATDHCVRATALDAEAAGFDTRVLLDHTVGVASDTVGQALEQMRGAGIELVGHVRGAG